MWRVILEGRCFLSPAFLIAAARVAPLTFVPVGSMFLFDVAREYAKFM